MARISNTPITTFGDILKQRKIEAAKVAKEKAAEIQRIKDIEFDKFVKNTAKDILKDSFRYDVKVFKGDVLSSLE